LARAMGFFALGREPRFCSLLSLRTQEGKSKNTIKIIGLALARTYSEVLRRFGFAR